MSNFSEQLRVRGKAEEDLYFARRDRELLEAMKRDKLAKALDLKSKKARQRCGEIEDDFDRVSKQFSKKPGKLAKAYRSLLEKVRKLMKKASKK